MVGERSIPSREPGQPASCPATAPRPRVARTDADRSPSPDRGRPRALDGDLAHALVGRSEERSMSVTRRCPARPGRGARLGCHVRSRAGHPHGHPGIGNLRFRFGMLVAGCSSLESPDSGTEPSDTANPVGDRSGALREEHPRPDPRLGLSRVAPRGDEREEGRGGHMGSHRSGLVVGVGTLSPGAANA